MAFHAYTRIGASIAQPTEEQMRALLDSLADSDDEHPDVSVTHETGWSISAFHSGLVIFENVETGEGPWQMRSVSRDATLALWMLLAGGNIQEIRERPWLPGDSK